MILHKSKTQGVLAHAGMLPHEGAFGRTDLQHVFGDQQLDRLTDRAAADAEFFRQLKFAGKPGAGLKASLRIFSTI